SGGNGRSIFIGSPNPEYTGYYTLEAGKLICTDLIGPRFTNPQYISTNFFNWTGGLLSCRTFEARLLVGGTLTNAGGIFAPGDIGLAASTTVNGGYYVASSNAVLAIDLGGTMPANQAAGVVGVAGAYDNVRAEDAWLAGRLEVRFMDGFEATVTALDSFTILTTSPTHLSLHGTFDNVGTNGRVNVVNFPNFSFRVTINDASVVLDDFSGPPPQLAIRPEPMTPGLVTVSWATNAVGFVLQSAPRADAAPNDWADIPPELIFQNGALNEYFEFVEGTSGAFFRLRKN
ncbi:MAG: hypothetical protein L0Y58_20900, partial [Verrucomicrobia subdivision 3 bacterium]|nr:hypothetical protein [Limisphaerales bacterium]